MMAVPYVQIVTPEVDGDENSRKIRHIEKCFGASGMHLLNNGREFIAEGVFMKICRKKPKERGFFLFSDVLVYGNIIIAGKKYNKQHVLPLEDMKVEDVYDTADLQNAFKIQTPLKSFIVCSSSAMEKSLWMSKIQRCIGQFQVTSASRLRKFSEDASPVWVPDTSADSCMHCRTSKFTLLNRRHHCRKCGLVVCKTCSSNKFLLPNVSQEPVRVCLTCYHQLKGPAKCNTLYRKGQGVQQS